MNIKSTDKILVVAPHPDDEALGCGGFMLRYAQQVDSFCFVSSGISPNAKEKSSIRMSEWNEAQKFIGCNNLGICEVFGDKPLLPYIHNNMDMYLKMLDTSKYDYILMPHIEDDHPEHQYISSSIMYEIINKNGYKKNAKICFYEVWKVLNTPNLFVEIDAIEKEKLLSVYKSQWNICNLPKKIIGLNCYRSINCGTIGNTEYAEAFYVLPVKHFLESTKPVEEIIDNKDTILKERIQVNFISNRFDLLYGNDYELYDLGSGVVPVHIDNKTAYLGLYLSIYQQQQLNRLYELLFAKHQGLEKIYIKHCLVPAGIQDKDNIYYHYPYWHIDLPTSIEEFDAKLDKYIRRNTKRYPKKIEQDFGMLKMERYDREQAPEIVINLLFKWKKESKNFDYNMTEQEYLDKFGVTDVYTLIIKDEIIAVGTVCTTDNNSYFDQIAYSQDKKYAKYSLGMILYYKVICDQILAGRTKFYLSGGWLDYKKWYNGSLQYTYTGIIYKHKPHHHSFLWRLKHCFINRSGT